VMLHDDDILHRAIAVHRQNQTGLHHATHEESDWDEVIQIFLVVKHLARRSLLSALDSRHLFFLALHFHHLRESDVQHAADKHVEEFFDHCC
jgi:hypothetical protein